MAIKKAKGGSLTGLNASDKRDNGIDPNGPWTIVQKKALAGAKGKAKLTKDKELGATKMKMGGKIKKACSGTSLYPKSSSVSSKLKAGGKIKKAQAGDTLKKKYPTIDMYSTKNYDLKKTTYPGGDTKTETTFKPNGGVKFDVPSIKKKAKAKDGKWIQKAVNPAHKGYCTPMTKATCTPKRKALAKTFKAMAAKRKGK